jgi:phytoene dehydrogenase-like protein
MSKGRSVQKMTSIVDFDSVVIGAGAGGICAAARLAYGGHRTLLVETLGQIGGRASTRDVNGFLCNTGALVIELDGMVAQTYRDLGLPLQLYEPKQASTVLRIGRRDINMSEGLGGYLRDALPLILRILTKVVPGFQPKAGDSVLSWLSRITKNPSVHGLVDNVLGAMFAANLANFPADVFFHYFTKGTGFKKIGMPVGGTINVWKPLIEVLTANGGEVWLNSKVVNLTFAADGRVNGVVIDREGEPVTVSTRSVVSNAGPLATVRLAGRENLPPGYALQVEEDTAPAAIITAHFASQTPLAKFPCLALFAKSRRLVYAGNFSAPELQRGPPGWHLYCGASVPRPSQGEFDVAQETELLFEDLREHFPGFSRDMVIAVDVTAHEWPAQRAITGYDLPQVTPIDNLWNVGDGVKQWGDAGTAACAETARIVAGELLSRYPGRRNFRPAALH